LLEVADIFRDLGWAWRDANRGHVSLGQLKVMSAIESCRTAALGACCALRERRLRPYPSRYTHRVAISNRRLVAADDGGVSFRWKTIASRVLAGGKP
jgi:hypothetical protein